MSVAHEVASDFAHFDSRILRTLRALLTTPGLLSKVYFGGGRSRYTKPLTLFVVLNVMFFVVQPHSGLLGYKYSQYLNTPDQGVVKRIKMVREKLVTTGESEKLYEARFNSRLQEQKKSMLIIAVPILALAMSGLYARKRRYYVEHLVFAIHVYAFLLIALTLLVGFLKLANYLAQSIGPSATPFFELLDGEVGISVILGTALVTHIFFGLKRAYSDGGVSAALRATALATVIVTFTGYYRNLLFYTTYFTT